MRRRICSTVLGRTEAVVEADQIEFSAVDAAHLVGHLAISDFRPPVHAVGRGGSAVRHGLADLDLGIGDAGRVGGLRRPCPRDTDDRARARLQKRTTRQHYLDAPPHFGRRNACAASGIASRLAQFGPERKARPARYELTTSHSLAGHVTLRRPSTLGFLTLRLTAFVHRRALNDRLTSISLKN